MRKEKVPKKYSPKMVVKNGDLPWYKVESNLEQTKAVKLITLAATNIGSMMIYGNVISTVPTIYFKPIHSWLRKYTICPMHPGQWCLKNVVEVKNHLVMMSSHHQYCFWREGTTLSARKMMKTPLKNERRKEPEKNHPFLKRKINKKSSSKPLFFGFQGVK